MSKEIKLKPCPFCGGEAELASDAFDGRQVWFVRCRWAGGGVYVETEDGGTPQEAAELWNRRAGEDLK